ncbi:MAG: low molecular weight phosphotyrosine protein phosphatase [Ruminococcaceae bacterium]|nr:low molecular weight phosphotyrosine protein phosphatase [Oscillospiraceae bacterium]
MTKIMFVCYGNICRSPSAEIIFRDMVKKRSIEGDFVIASSATSTEEIWNGVGNPMYPPMVKELERHGYSVGDKRAVQLTYEDYEKYDLFIGMDSSNIRDMHRILKGDPDGKIHRLMDYTSRGGDVADPWYSRDFTAAYLDIYDGCAGLLDSF